MDPAVEHAARGRDASHRAHGSAEGDGILLRHYFGERGAGVEPDAGNGRGSRGFGAEVEAVVTEVHPGERFEEASGKADGRIAFAPGGAEGFAAEIGPKRLVVAACHRGVEPEAAHERDVAVAVDDGIAKGAEGAGCAGRGSAFAGEDCGCGVFVDEDGLVVCRGDSGTAEAGAENEVVGVVDGCRVECAESDTGEGLKRVAFPGIGIGREPGDFYRQHIS